jgi:hypothetical protein
MAATSRKKELSGYPVEYLACRDLTHSWDAYTVVDQPGGLWLQTILCHSCGGMKDRVVRRRTGAVVRDWGHIHYPEGYLIKGGRLDYDERNEVRRLAITARLA